MNDFDFKLTPDGIVEALLEVRFETASFPELTIGNLISREPWRGLNPMRLPTAEIPHFVRNSDPNLKFQPTLQLNSPEGLDVVKVGENVLSLHRLGSYPGWEKFGPQLHQGLRELFEAVPDARITRLGFRYVNLLGSAHHINSLNDLSVDLRVGGAELLPPINLNYMRREDDFEILVRAASPEFVQGPSNDFAALIDIDVYTSDTTSIKGVDDCSGWLEKAHVILKQRFFELLRPEAIQRLGEKR